jgi:hypothetical protein
MINQDAKNVIVFIAALDAGLIIVDLIDYRYLEMA